MKPIYYKPSFNFIVNEYMKRAISPCIKDSQTLDCVTRFQLIPPNIIAKDTPLFSAFSKNRLRKLSNDVNQIKSNRSQNLVDVPKNTQDSNPKSLLFNKGQIRSILQGVLKSRKSNIKKIKLKQFYLEDPEQNKLASQRINQSIQASLNMIDLKNSTQFNTIEARNTQASYRNMHLPSKRKLLPPRLRAKSYSNIPKSLRENNTDLQIEEENSLSINARSKRNVECSVGQKKMTLQCQKVSSRCNFRRTIKSGKLRNISINGEKELKVLGDVTLQLNEIPVNLNSQNESKHGNQIKFKHRKNIKSQCIAKFNESFFEINPWGNSNNENDKENEIFHF